jgi:hypothetical protein
MKLEEYNSELRIHAIFAMKNPNAWDYEKSCYLSMPIIVFETAQNKLDFNEIRIEEEAISFY